ncbi:hypothetical protein MKW98_021300 [Papaver atlanticum]|uniref:Uncharacterized protein n=1 Tax=Papaver atlanticum TaxID=357466 RepID=A0AAD4SRI4_9MAGN|nr:hypothetical protein MKW98_021300 [Papaver atlanticum]
MLVSWNSEVGTIQYHLIPTRSYWLSMVRDDWGTTDDEIKASMLPGYGVILRDSMRNPIIVISKVSDEYVSPFYHELQGVSLGLKLALKYKFYHFKVNFISEDVAGYVMQSWQWKYACDCPERDNPENPNEKKYYCVECSKIRLNQTGERKNVDKILTLIDEIFYDALELEREGNFPCFRLSTTKLSRAQAVWHLANSGIDQALRLDEIDEDEEIAEILYKEVYGHGSVEELMLQHKMEKEERKLKKDLYWARTMRAEELGMDLLENCRPYEESWRVKEIN